VHASGRVESGLHAFHRSHIGAIKLIAAPQDNGTDPSDRPRTKTMHGTFSVFYLDQNGATQ
jgi:hypothetical protein